MTALSAGPGMPEPTPSARAAAGSLHMAAQLDPLDRAAFDLAMGEEMEQGGPEADVVALAERAMARLRRWQARRAEGGIMTQLDRGRTLAALGEKAARPHPDRHLVAACERLLMGGEPVAHGLALQDRIARMHARTALGRRAKAEVALALLETTDLPAATLARSVILEALAGLPADRG